MLNDYEEHNNIKQGAYKVRQHLIYYITVTFFDDTQTVIKMIAMDSKNAIYKLMRQIDRDDIKRVSVPTGIPKTKHNRQKALNIKRAQRERRKKEAIDKIVKYDGTKKID